MKTNNRLLKVSEYHFKTINDIKNKLKAKNIKITDLSIGDPDLSVDKSIIDELVYSLNYSDFNKYPPYDGIKELKLKIIEYYRQIYFVNLELDEVIILIGSKEGISNLIPAVCDIGDYIIIPNPRYPVYEMCANLWGNNPYKINLREKDDYLLNLKDIPNEIAKKSKLMIINYPNNPTGAVANSQYYKELIKYCNKKEIILCNDGAYNEIIKENKNPISILQYDNEKTSVEFGSFSKTYNMTGFRIGYAVGNKKVLNSLLKIKSNIDSGQFKPIQCAAIKALELNRKYVNNIRKVYNQRRKAVEKILSDKKINFYKTNGTFYIWCKVPENYTTDEFCEELLYNYGIIVTPGYAFGKLDNNYFRISLTVDEKTICESLNKLKVYN
ncbi:aminotransferase class I/II-fold pyridoxal phosphate-dependent enzyme [Clostridium aestuarii]|uniref:Aminotransferase n=1 Tax=Clostridium aestuarii TaxID=338193 RepID=A0ABT4CYE6_9CLOT|nr:aminotransferase class I/II-fold pyridoxal phosphate-dependent enzyme [Clostridium aestuarii]MCY6484011.1 aminotransferase class I/II-fold pyridoxal phosphate-dependent enzyme [Clostridium aestuarii]